MQREDMEYIAECQGGIQCNSINNICDARLYQEGLQSGFLRNPHNVSFLMNTDGVPVFKSSAYSFWPLFLLINELIVHTISPKV